MKNLVSEAPYLPLQGMNPDGNGISIQTGEAPWMENLRPMAKGIRSREGFRGLFSFVQPPAFYHFHYLSNSQITTALSFGFSKRAIWQYAPGTYPYWKPLRATLQIANVIDSAGTNVSYAKDSEYFDQGFFAEFLDTESGTYSNTVDGVFPINAALVHAAGNLILFYLPGVTNPVAKLSDASTLALEADGDFFWLPLPTAKTLVSLSCDEDEFPRGLAWIFQKHFNCTFFSTCEVLDDGSYKLVMAGSNPPELGKEETDQAQRVLWEYGGSSWADKTISQQWSVGREDTGILLPGGTTLVTDGTIFNSMVSGDTIIPGSVRFFTLEKGEICKASANLVSGKYILYSDDAYVNEGTSYVYPNGKWGIQLTHLGATYFGTGPVYADYSYKTPFSFKPRHLTFYAGRLVFGGTYEGGNYYPWRVRSAYAGDSNTAIEYDYVDLLDYGLETLECLKQLGNSLFAYTREGIYRGFTDQNGNLLFTSFWSGGTISGRTVAIFNNLHFFMGVDDIYAFDGSSVRSITLMEGVGRVKETIFRRIDTEHYQRCFSAFYPKEKEVWFFVKRVTEDYPVEAWIYNVDRANWTLFRFEETLSIGHYAEESFPTWDGLGDLTWDDLQSTWDELGVSSSRRNLLLGTSRGPVLVLPDVATELFATHSFSGPFASEVLAAAAGSPVEVAPEWFAVQALSASPISWYFISRDFIYNHLERKDRTLLCDFEALGDSVFVAVQGDYSLDPTLFEQGYIIPLESIYTKKAYHPDFYDYAIRYLFQGTGFFDFRWMQTKAKIYKHKGEV